MQQYFGLQNKLLIAAVAQLTAEINALKQGALYVLTLGHAAAFHGRLL